jgi:uncharacterized protein
MEYALITGASSGIGSALAKMMASKGHNLILVARSEQVLRILEQTLKAQYSIAVEVMAMDLSLPGQAEALYQNCKGQDYTVNCLVNNAGYGDYGKFNVHKIAVYINMIQLNIIALTELTAYFAEEMKQRGAGRILNVGSIGAFQPSPNLAAYAASKAYVMQFTEALNYELRGTGVSVTLLSPGVTDTGFINRANMQTAANAKSGLMDAKTVAKEAYEAMMAGKLNVTPGWKNKLLTFGSRMMPSREVLLQIAGIVLKDTAKSTK